MNLNITKCNLTYDLIIPSGAVRPIFSLSAFLALGRLSDGHIIIRGRNIGPFKQNRDFRYRLQKNPGIPVFSIFSGFDKICHFSSFFLFLELN